MKQLVKAICIVGIGLMMLAPVYAGNPQKKNPIAEYPQCQTQLNTFHTINKQIRAMPSGEVPSTMIVKKMDAWRAYKVCVKEQKKVAKDSKDHYYMQPTDQTELQQRIGAGTPK